MLANVVSPYSSEYNRFTEDESLEIIDNLFKKDGFVDTDALVYHGGPSEEEDEARFEVFQEVAHLLQSNQNNVDIYMPDDQLHRVEESDEIHSGSVKSFDPETTTEDIEMSVGREYKGDTIAVTSDYHMERVDSLYNEMTEGDYLVLGADSSDHVITSIEKSVGPFNIKIPVNNNIAELNELKNLNT